MLTWSEKLSLLTTKGLTWKEVQEMDKGLDAEKTAEPTPETKPETKPETTPETKPETAPEPTPEENEPDEKDLKIAELEQQLKEAQAENVHGNNEGKQLSFDEQLESMFKDYRI